MSEFVQLCVLICVLETEYVNIVLLLSIYNNNSNSNNKEAYGVSDSHLGFLSISRTRLLALKKAEI